MTGMCGIVTFDGTPVARDDIAAMVGAAPHRGPTHQRWESDAAILVGQRRDCSYAASLATADRDLVVLADARIDNRRELWDSLGRAGRVRAEGAHTEPDDGVLIGAAYRHWGSAFVDRLIGDFALVVWDPRRRRLTMARDPMSMRSLYYRHEPGRRTLFATEAKQILAAGGVPRQPNERAVLAFLATRLRLIEDETYWQGVSQVAAGHVLVCDDGRLSRRRYWDVDPDHRVFHGDERAAAEHVAQVLTEAVAARMGDARAPAILLSGGMDSGSAAAIGGMLSRRGQVPSRLTAYCWAFDELTQCDERHISQHIVQCYDLRVRDVGADDAGPLAGHPAHDVDVDDPMVGAFQPLIERSLGRARDDGIDVMLGGDRGDLVLGDTGNSYLRMAQARRWMALRHELREHRRALDDTVPTMVRRHLMDAVAGRLRRRDLTGWLAWTAAHVRSPGRHASTSTPLPPWIIETASAAHRELEQPTPAPQVPSGLGDARARRYRYIFTPLHQRGMVWSERTYAKYGIGFADPFSDLRLVELALALPQAVINRPGDQSKPLLRNAMRGIMPEPARTGADKILPTPLYERGLRLAAPTIHGLLIDARTEQRGWVDAAALRAHYDAWLTGRPLDPAFWYALSVERWLRVQEQNGAASA